MRYESGQQFLDDPKKRIMLIGLSGVGKTTISQLLVQNGWEQYSVDYHIGTNFLKNEISKLFKSQKDNDEFINDLTSHDSIDTNTYEPIVSKDNLYAISKYIGMVGNPNKGGLTENEFRKRLFLHSEAEHAATLESVTTGVAVNGNFVTDASGSLCEIVNFDNADDGLIGSLGQNLTVIHIASNDEHDKLLAERQKIQPKPLYYRQEFLDEYLPQFVAEKGLSKIEEADPSDVGNWMLPKLLETRRVRYAKIVEAVGYEVAMNKVHNMNTEDDFLSLVAESIDQANV